LSLVSKIWVQFHAYLSRKRLLEGSENEGSNVKRVLVLVTAAVLVAGCAVNTVSTQGFSGMADQTRVLLMPPDIKYYLLTASGITEPQAEWTAQAREAFGDAFENFSRDSGFTFDSSHQAELSDTAIEYDQLHSAVGATIVANHYGPIKLPSKKDQTTSEYTFDWSLGSGVGDLTEDSDADYALFVYFRDYQASGGRVAMAVFAALLNTAIYTGHQGGFASLVDLKTGDVVWFNNIPAVQGNMRTREGADKIVEKLFAGLTAG
jgi:hypothetical protein